MLHFWPHLIAEVYANYALTICKINQHCQSTQKKKKKNLFKKKNSKNKKDNIVK